ncbi:hypothetical protein GCM10023149_45770 [Mucilaginibacter gynuensis]|uniref:Zinc finger domain-containing protein, LSD1 subclass n=1 Tax=Mucilaginibacter gynuensis TaxID=1302236 RepID=A0ABP8HAL9_9SPHI
MEPEASAVINNSLNCKGCGAILNFAPGTHSLKCNYCGVSNEIESAPDSREIITLDYEAFIAQSENCRQDAGLKTVKCNSCGSSTVLAANVTADKCPFCTSPLVLDLSAEKQYVRPHYVLPFFVTKDAAIQYFQKWMKGLWFAPNDLVKKVSGNMMPSLQGVYIPHWAFDADTNTRYEGQRGEHYYVTETYTENVNGRSETRTRQVRHTRWYSASGTVQCDFRDLVVPASKSLPTKTLNKLGPWAFNMLLKFDERYISGFRAETYQLAPEAGFDQAVIMMQPEIESAIRNDIGGDEQRIDDTDSDYFNKGIKYLMLPVWVSSYTYSGKVYQFTINASTGEVIGERPLSWIKITLTVLLVIILLIIGFMVFGNK